MAAPDLSRGAPNGDRRDHPREPVVASTVVRPESQFAALEVETRDLSTTGCMFVSDHSLPVGARVILGLNGAGRANAIVVRSAGHAHACVFERPLSAAEQKSAFTGTAILQLAESYSATPARTADIRLPRHQRYRLVIALGALAWAIPGLAYLAWP